MADAQMSREQVESYVEQMAAMIGLPIPTECKQGVVDNMVRTAAIAQLVLEFPLPDEIEPGPVFEPRC